MIPASVRLSFYLGAAVFFARGAVDGPQVEGVLARGDGVVRGEPGAGRAGPGGADARRSTPSNGGRQIRLGWILFVVGALLSVVAGAARPPTR